MVNEKLARRYAIAVMTLAREQGAVERVGADLLTISKGIRQAGLAREFFVAPVVERREKERILRETFEGRVHPTALHALLLLVRKRREALLDTIVAEYLALQRTARGIQTLTVQSARALPQAERLRLTSRLEALYGKKFELTEVVDPRLIGGVRLMMGDRRIDGTIAGRLNALAYELVQTTWP